MSEILGTDEKIVREIIDKMKNDLRQYKDRSDIKFKGGVATYREISFDKTSLNVIPDRAKYSVHYKELLDSHLQNKEMLKTSIRYAEIVIQPRTFDKLILVVNDGHYPVLKVALCLPEYGQLFHNWWVGKEIDSNSFNKLVDEFKRDMAFLNIGGVIIEEYPSTSCTVTGTKQTFNTI